MIKYAKIVGAILGSLIAMSIAVPDMIMEFLKFMNKKK